MGKGVLRTGSWTRGLALAGALICAPAAFADGPAEPIPDVAAPPVRAQPLAPRAETAPPAQTAAAPAPEGRIGQMSLAEGEISLNVPQGYRFYAADEAQAFLQRHGAAAPKGQVLGLIAKGSTPPTEPESWATVVSYDPIGYVPAEGASALAEPSLEQDVRAARDGQGRPFQGFAAQPEFDSASTHLTWAERTAAPGQGGRDLRHEQKVLGRKGVAGLTSIGSLDQMTEIGAAAPEMRAMLAFPAGQTYGDFQPVMDQTSSYNMKGLVTGVAANEPVMIADAASAGSAGGGEGQSGASGIGGMFPWIALGVAALAGLGYVLTRKRRNDDPNLAPDA